MTLAGVATGPDLLRLVAVPVFAWVAVRDIKTRRVSSGVWIPLALLGALLLGWEGWTVWQGPQHLWAREFLLPAAVSLGFVVPIAYLFWWFGGFGGADAKALLVIAVLFPTSPAYDVGSWTLPLAATSAGQVTPVGTLSFTILTNAVIVAVVIPLVLAVRNAAAGRIAPVMFIGWPVAWDDLPERHGRLLETATSGLRGGLDLDALRMYLRWRGLTLSEVRARPDYYRDPDTLPAEPNPPTDGAVTAALERDGGSTADNETVDGEYEHESATGGHRSSEVATAPSRPDEREFDDPWGADAFLTDIEGSAYGTTPADLREGLEAVVENETVWISPGTPFLVPVFLGLVIALLYGDLLLGAVL